MKYLSRLLCIGSIVLFFLSVSCIATAQTQTIHNLVTIETRNVSYQTEEIIVELEIPVLRNMADEGIQELINTMFDEDATSFVEEVRSGYPEYAQDAEEYDFEPHLFSAYTEFEITFNQGGILSIPVTYYQFTGGAHGMTVLRSYNLDLESGNLFQLIDILNDEQREIVNNQVKNQLQEDDERFFPDAAEEFEGIADNQNFYLKNGNLVVYFDLYELGPYAMGIPEFPISFASLELTLEDIKQALY